MKRFVKNSTLFLQRKFCFVTRLNSLLYLRNSETARCFKTSDLSNRRLFSTSSQLLEAEKIKRKDFDIPERQVEIYTCKELYNTWKKQKKFWKVPEDALKFTVKYVDTQADLNSNQSKLTVLMLHGAPGHYKDFQRNITFLNEHGIRVIAPNFPDFTFYEPGIFRFSPEEKAEYVKEFLKSINVSKIDALISHSSSIYTSLLLCLEKKFPIINSLILLNPGTHKAMPNLMYAKLLVQVSEIKFGRLILRIFGSFLLKAFKTPVNFDNVFDPLLSATTMVQADFWKVADHLRKLHKENYPILFAFSSNDKLISKKRNYEMASLLGVKENDMWHYDATGKEKRKGAECQWLKVMEFEAGSHYVFWKHSEVINKAILEHLSKSPLN